MNWIQSFRGSKAKKGTSVVLHVLRDGKEVEVTAVRDKIEVQTVAYEMKEDQIGYIAVSEFDSVTYHQFETALEDLEKQGMKGLVIDLRNNPGGNFDTVTDMLKLLLPEGVIVSTKKDKEGNVEEVTCDGANEFDKPLAVLVKSIQRQRVGDFQRSCAGLRHRRDRRYDDLWKRGRSAVNGSWRRNMLKNDNRRILYSKRTEHQRQRRRA